MRANVVLLGVLCGCAPSTATTVPQGARLVYTEADSASHVRWHHYGSYGYEKRHREVIRDSASWRGVWDSMYPGPGPRPTVPVVNFDSLALVVVSAGTFSSTGSAITIDSILSSSKQLYVVVHSVLCKGYYAAGALVTSPMDIVAIPARYRRVRFVEVQTAIPGCHPWQDSTSS